MHAQLQQQLCEALGLTTNEALAAWLADPAATALPASATLAQGFKTLLQAVDTSYQQFDRAQELRLQSLATGASELAAMKKQLRKTSDQAQQVTTRFETLRRISSDWYWEQDDQFRFILVPSDPATLFGRGDTSHLIGKTPWEYFGGPADDPLWQAHCAALQAHECFENFVFKVNAPDAEPHFVTVSGEPVFDAQGAFTGYRGTARDCTVDLLAQQKLRASLQMTEALIEATPTPICIKDEHQRFTHMNAAYERFLERSRGAMLGKTFRDLYGDLADHSDRIERSILENPRILQYEARRSLPSGSDIHILVAKGPVINAESKVVGVVSTYSDISNLKQAQARLSEQLRVTDTLIESAPMAISIKDEQQRFTRVNTVFEKEFGVRREDLIGRTTQEVSAFGPDQSGAPVEAELRNAPGVRTYSRMRNMPDGGTRHYSTTKATITDTAGKLTGFMTVHADVTELKNAEQLAEHRLQMTNILLNASPAPTMTKDAHRKITYINSAYENLFGVKREDILGLQMRPDQPNAAISDIERADAELLQAPGIRQFENELTGSDGHRVTCLITKSSYLDPTGAVMGIITTYSDITRLRQAERAAEEQLRLTNILLNATPTPLVVKNRDLQITLVNTAYEDMFGVKREEALNKAVSLRRPNIASVVLRSVWNLSESLHA